MSVVDPIDSSGVAQPVSYAFPNAHDVPDEARRLDDLHTGFTAFFGGSLSFAPLEQLARPSILELGAGSGAWAIQAAKQFPHGQVIAVDLNDLPIRTIPPNMKFQKCDITQPFPFEKASFDIVHARLVFIHLPDVEAILKRVTELLKPGGWLLLEESDDTNVLDREHSPGPGVSAFLGAWFRVLHARGADPAIGRQFKTFLSTSNAFSEIHTQRSVISLSGKRNGLDALGLSYRNTAHKVAEYLPAVFSKYGIPANDDIGRRHIEELYDPSRDITTDIYVAWARKKAD